MANDRLGTIQLNGKYYRIDLNSYRGRDVTDFSPRASTPGGGIVFSEMNAYQVIGQDDWRHGFGFPWFSDSAGYSVSNGCIDTRDAHRVRLFSEPTSLGVLTDFVCYGFAKSHVGDGATSVWLAYGNGATAGSCGLWKSTLAGGIITGWSAIATFNTTIVRSVWSNGGHTFALLKDGRIQVSTDASLATWADTGNTACSINYGWIVPHDGFVFAGKAADGTLTGGAHPGAATHHWYSNQVFFSPLDTLSDLEGAEEDDTDEITVGIKGRGVIKCVSFNGDLFFIRQDSIYKMDKDRSAARRVLDYSDQVDNKNFKICTVFNGALYFNIRDRVYQWNGVRTADVTPPDRLASGGDTVNILKYREYYASCVIGNFLYVTAHCIADDGTHTYDLLWYDGVGWGKLLSLSNPPNGLGYDPDHNQLMYQDSVTDYVWYVHPNTTTGSAGHYKTNTNLAGSVEYLETSIFDAGFRLITKSTPSILVQCSGMVVSKQEIYVYYRIDSTSPTTTWLPWGGSTTTARLSTNGLTTLANPLADASGQSSLEYKWIQFRFVFVNTELAHTPVLEAFGLRLIMRPATGYGYSFNVIGAKSVQYARGRTDDRKPSEIIADLRTARNSTKWVTYVDPYGVSHLVYVTAVNEIAVEEHIDELGNVPNIEQMITVNVLEIL